MTTENKLIYGQDSSKHPLRLGKPWKDDEVVKLLTSIQKKKPIKDIATEHERTVGGICSYINKLAADYHFNNKLPIEEIQKFTGLNKGEIEDAIKRRAYKDSVRKSVSEMKKKITPTISTEADLLHEIKYLKEEVSEMKKDIKQMLSYITSIYEFEKEE